jgi:hypothetical protein
MAVSCAGYDAGDHSEALRLATVVYNLVHDSGGIRSIMGLLGIKDTHMFLATNVTDGAKLPAIVHRFTPLVEFERKSIRPHFVPLVTYFQNRNSYFPVRDLSFDAWWNKDIIFLEGPHRMTRRQLVFALRNQEGGSHYDEEVRNPNFHPLKQSFWMMTPGLGFGEMGGLELASMRQIAEEVELSFVHIEKKKNPNAHSHITVTSIDELEKRFQKNRTV